MGFLDTTASFVASNEGFSLTAYKDVSGIPTIGYGSTMINNRPVKMGMTITQIQAEYNLTIKCDLLKEQILHIVNVPINDNQLNSLVDFCYNLGISSFYGSSLYKAINGQFIITEDLFTRWDKIHKDGNLIVVPGLLERRQKEFELFTREEA